jgi:transcriptional regulator with XRE-family HTH domain
MAELQKADITARIREARIESGLTQPEMAELLDVGSRTYQNYESDRVPWGLLGRIADATGRSVPWLLHGREEPPIEGLADLERKLDKLLLHFGLDVETISGTVEAFEAETDDADERPGGQGPPRPGRRAA